MYVGSLLFCLTMVLPINLCVAMPASKFTSSWLVSIHKQEFGGNSERITYYCAGVLIKPDTVLTSAKCFDPNPKISQMVIVAGGESSSVMTGNTVQLYFPFGTQFLENRKIVSIFIGKSIQRTNHVDIITQCTEHNCIFDSFGIQYGWAPHRGYAIYDFSNSSALCMDLNEDTQNKYCTYHDCSQYPFNSGGEFVIKVHEGQPFLMGFWDYDECDKSIRVFDKLRDSESSRRRLF